MLVTQYENDINDDENDNRGEEFLANDIAITDDGRRYPTRRRMEPDRTIPLAKGPTHSSSRQMARGVVSAQIESIFISYNAGQPEGARGRIVPKKQYYGADQA